MPILRALPNRTAGLPCTPRTAPYHPPQSHAFSGDGLTMSSPAVHWQEGMFLRPQHFQTAQRNWAHLIERNSKWDQHYNWGLRTLDLDLDALTNHRLVVRALEARLRD